MGGNSLALTNVAAVRSVVEGREPVGKSVGDELEKPLREVIATLRSVVHRRRLAESAAWGGGAALFGLLVAGWALARGLPRPATDGWWLVLAAGLLTALGFYLRGRSGRSSDHALAELLERRFPQLRTDLRTLLDFAARPPAEEGAALAAALRERLTQEIPSVALRAEEAAPPARLRPPAVLIAAAVAAVAVSYGLSPDAFAPALRRMVDGTRAQAIPEAFAEPLVTTIDLEIEPPAHTGLPRQSLQGTNGDILAAAGSRVMLSGGLLTEASEVYLEVTDEAGTQRVAATVAGGRFTATFAVLTNGSYRIGIGPVQDGRFDPIARSVAVVADQLPVVAFLEPESDMEVAAADKVALKIQASDDYGLVEVAWSWKLEGQSGPAKREVLRSPERALDYTESLSFDLEPLKLASGDVIVLQADGSDLRATGEAGKGLSREIRIRVRSEADKNEAILAEKEALFEALLTQLSGQLTLQIVGYGRDAASSAPKIVASPAPISEGERPGKVLAAQRVHGAWGDLLSRWQAMLKSMEEDRLTPDRERMLLTAALERVRGDERALNGEIERLSRGAGEGAVSASDFATLAGAQAAMIDATERAATLFDSLIASQKADALARNIRELADSRENLKALMEKYRDTRDPKVREQIDRELRRLAKRMKELMERIRSQMEKLPQEHLNMEGLDEDKASENLQEMAGALEQMEKLLNEGKIDEALAALDRMGKEMDSLEKEMGDPLAGASPDQLSELDRSMGEATAELDKVESQQQAIAEETAKLMEEARAETAKRMADEIAASLERAKQEVAEAKKALDAVDTPALRPGTRSEVAEMEQSLGRVESALRAGSVQEAARAAEEASSLFDGVREDISSLQQFEKGAARRASEGAERAAERGASGMRKVADEMNELLEKAQNSMSPGQRSKMGELSKRQAGTQQALNGLKQKLGGIREQFQLSDDPFAEPFGQTEQGMEQSRSELSYEAPGGAREGQQQAQEGLRALRKQMQSMTGKQRQKQQGQGGSQVSQDRVEVPKQGETGREAYRKRLLDAMREGGLDDYGDAIRSYYESLMQ